MTVQTSGRRAGQHARLTGKQQRFVEELLQDPQRVAVNAARRAGYAERGIRVSSTRLMQKPHVLAAIAAADAARVKRVEVKQDEVLRELKRIAQSDLLDLFNEKGQLRPLSEIPKRARRAIASIEVEHREDGDVLKLKLWDKPRALEALGRHLPGFYAPQKMEHELGHTTLEQLVPKRKPQPNEGSK